MGLIRVALAMAVLLSHMPEFDLKFIGGGLAVQAFFIVSGFYMALVLDGKYKDLGLFYSNRLLRLFPTYFFMMAATLAVMFGFGIIATFTKEGFVAAYQDPLAATLYAIENLILVGQEWLFWFTMEPDGTPVLDVTGAVPTETQNMAWQALLVPQAWSLSMELMFYALAPFLARLGWRTLIAIAAASIALRVAGNWLPVDYGLWQGRFFPTVLFLFVLGMLAHRALPLAARLPKALGVMLAAALLAMIVFLPLTGLMGELQRWIAYAAIAVCTPFVFNATKQVKWDRWIGELSYPIYMCQLLVLGVVMTWNPPFAPWIAIAATLAASALIYLLIDRPVDHWRQRRAERRVAPAAAPDPLPA